MAATNSKKRKFGHRDNNNNNDIKTSNEKIIRYASSLVKRHGKVVKSFECQKIVRMLKKLKQNDTQVVKRTREQKLEVKLEKLKNFDLDLLVKHCMKSLGLLDSGDSDSSEPDSKETASDVIDEQYDRAEDKGDEASAANNDEERITPCGEKNLTEMSDFERTVVEKMLQHKRLSDAMNEIKRKISLANEKIEKDDFRTNKNKKEPSRKRSIKDDDIFVPSLSGEIPTEIDEDGEDNGAYFDPYGLGDDEPPKKKNRKGQRARRAKAMAIEARKKGEEWHSINWREKKKRDDNSQHHKNGEGGIVTCNKPVKASEVASTGKDWKEEGSAHPSWLAKQREKKVGIVAFAGKKITFD